MRRFAESPQSPWLVAGYFSATIAPMSTFRRFVDSGLLLALALCLFTVWPLLQKPGLPNGTDTLYHIYRVAEMDRAWAHGVLVPSWAEAFYYGYGSPVFHYYASFTYYVTSILMRLFALDAVDSLRVLTVLCMLLAGGGMYLFMRDTMSKLAGILAALAYVYSPYMIFTEPYTRGAFPELLALALFPLVMWRYERLLRVGGGLNLVLAALGGGLLIISHNLMALVLTGLLGAWVVWRGIAALSQKRMQHAASLQNASVRPVMFALLALILGIGLAGYFWLPVIAEQDAARLGNLTAVAQLDFRHFFVPMGELLAFSPRPDAGAINGLAVHQLNLGVAQWVMAGAGVMGVVVEARHAAPLRRTLSFVVFFALASAVLIFLMLPAAAFLWEAVTRLALLQFPWRFLGPAGFTLAALAGLNALWLERLPARIGSPITALLVVLPIALAMPTLYVDEWDNTTVDTSVAAYHNAEVRGLQRATTFSDEYLPATVIVEPDANAGLLADYANGYPVDKANRAALPVGVMLALLDHGPQHDAWQIEADEGFTLEVLTYYFPGWQAEIDGLPLPVRPSEPHGLILMDVPAGVHIVRLFMGSTPARDAGIAITFGAAVVLAGIVTYTFLRRGASPCACAGHPSPLIHRYAVIAGGLIQLALMVIFMREGGVWVNSPPGTVRVAQNQVVYDLGESIQLLGYDLSRRDYRPGDRLNLTVYWYTRAPVEYGYASFVHISTGGPPLAQADAQNPAGRPTLEWTADGYIRDPYIIDLPVDMPPGTYQITVGLYTCDTRPPGECGNGDRLTVMDANGALLGDAVPLGAITVR